MLVINRKVGEKLVIGGIITIEVVRLNGYGRNQKVRLAITAPREVPIDREEIHVAKQAEKENAA